MEGVEEVIVIDNGSLNVKAGYSGEDLPRCLVESVVGDDQRLGKESDFYVGSDVQARQEICKQRRAIVRGEIADWDAMEKVWQYTFANQLQVSPEQANMPVMLTDTPLNAKAERERMAEIMFETFKVPSLYIATRAVLSLYAAGRTRGLVVQAGAGVCHAVPVFEGYALPHAITKLEVGGGDLTEYLRQVLAKKGHALSAAQMDIVRDIKGRHCYIPPIDRPQADVAYELPDGNVINIDTESQTSCAEALFNPKVLGIDSAGLGELAHQAIAKCDVDLQRDLNSAVVLAGGSSMLPGFSARMYQEVASRAAPGVEPHIVPDLRPGQPRERGYNTQRKFGSWIGGSIFASLPTFSQVKITKQEWEEQGGKSIVHHKCF